jgi:hypothetical protein
MIAGHDFGHGRCSCGRRLADIAWAAVEPSAACVGQPGIAHVGNLTTTERDQIVAAVEAMRAATIEVSAA